jgi:hypothetical protein
MLNRTTAFFRKEFLLVLIVAVTVLLRVPSLFEPLWYGDEAMYVTIAERLLHGDLLYVDIYDHKPPLLYYLTAGSFAVFGSSVASLKILALLSSVGAIIAAYLVALRLFGKAAALVGVAVLSLLITPTFLEANIAGSEILMIFPTCVGILLGLQRRYFLAGCSFGLAFLIKGPAVFDFGAFFVFLALSAEKGAERKTLNGLALLTGGFLAPFVASLLFFAVQGALVDYIEAAFLSGADYTDQANGDGSFLSSRGRLVLNGLPALLLTAAWAIRKLRQWAPGEAAAPSPFEFLLLWLAFSFYGVLLGGRPYEHYLVQAAPPVALLSGFALTRTDRRCLVAAGALLIVLGVARDQDFDVARRANLEYYERYNRNFIKYVFGDKGFEEYADHFDPRTARNYRVGSLLLADSGGADESLYVFADQPAMYFRSRLDPVSRFIVFHHLGWHEEWKRETALAIAQTPPLYIVAEEPPVGGFPALEQAIMERYTLFASDGVLRVYKRID